MGTATLKTAAATRQVLKRRYSEAWEPEF